MKLEKKLADEISNEATKLVRRYHEYHNAIHIEHKRNLKRLGINAPDKSIHKPSYWKEDRKFNPFYVQRKCKSIARAIARRIINRTYNPNKPIIKSILKPDGSYRQVSIYQIPDAAVSKLFFNQLLDKNKHRFSSFSYAYRTDRNVHYAIQDIAVDLSQNARTFVAEFDFSDFFGSISHKYLENQFDKNGFYISQDERFIIKSFLSDRKVGIPQGTSISLFLANLTCWKLDSELEKEGVKFSRYADDTIIWSPDYAKICNAFSFINEFSDDAGVNINASKSDGISLLTRKGFPSEISSKESLNFLGYSLSVDSVSIKQDSVDKIKSQISYILYRNLIQPLKQKDLKGQVIPANNKDENFLVAMMQIRRYIYGGLKKSEIINFLSGRTKRLYFKGIMSFYPLVNDESQLRQLDGWLLSVTYRSLQLRSQLLKNRNMDRSDMRPFNLNRGALLQYCADVKFEGKSLLEVPSFLLIHRAFKRGLIEKGIEEVMNPNSRMYGYES